MWEVWGNGEMGEIFIKRDLRGLGEAARSWGGSAFTRGFPRGKQRCGRRFRTQNHAPLAIAVVSPTRALHG